MFCSLDDADAACGVSAATACAAVVDSPAACVAVVADSPLTGSDSDVCGGGLISVFDSLEAEVGCPAVASALAISVPAFGSFLEGARASVSSFGASPCLFAAIGLGSTAGPPSV